MEPSDVRREVARLEELSTARIRTSDRERIVSMIKHQKRADRKKAKARTGNEKRAKERGQGTKGQRSTRQSALEAQRCLKQHYYSCYCLCLRYLKSEAAPEPLQRARELARASKLWLGASGALGRKSEALVRFFEYIDSHAYIIL